MPSASELFYNRRHRLGRTPDDLGFHSLPDRDLHLNINHRRNYHRRHDVDGGDSLRRSTHMRQLCHRASHGDYVSARFDPGNSQSHLSSSVNVADAVENISSTRGPGVTGNDRLPIHVVLARARFLERVRGVPPSRYRLNSRRSLHLDELRGIHSVDHEGESSTNGFVGSSEVLDLTFQMGRPQFSQEVKNRPPGLTQEALDRLPLEIYGTEAGLESTEVQDCGICLEIFRYGDELICLPCGHRFHSACLDPWIRSCGDCPYCRRTIVV